MFCTHLSSSLLPAGNGTVGPFEPSVPGDSLFGAVTIIILLLTFENFRTSLSYVDKNGRIRIAVATATTVLPAGWSRVSVRVSFLQRFRPALESTQLPIK